MSFHLPDQNLLLSPMQIDAKMLENEPGRKLILGGLTFACSIRGLHCEILFNYSEEK